MMTNRIFAAALFALLAVTAPTRAEAEDVLSGGFLLPGCEILTGDLPIESLSPTTALQMTKPEISCLAAVHTAALIMHQDKVICPPAEGDGLTQLDEERAVVHYMTANPQFLKNSYASLIYVALKTTWPCH
jgi:Rap1a immunity proteins